MVCQRYTEKASALCGLVYLNKMNWLIDYRIEFFSQLLPTLGYHLPIGRGEGSGPNYK